MTKLADDNNYHILVMDQDAAWQHRLADDIGTELVVERLGFLPNTASLPRHYDGVVLGAEFGLDMGARNWVKEVAGQGTKIILATWTPAILGGKLPAGVRVLPKEGYTPEALRIAIAELLDIPSLDPRRNITRDP